jgi:hypothetical protein
VARVRREPCALDLHRPRQAAPARPTGAALQERRGPCTPVWDASAQVHDPNTRRNLMPHIDSTPGAAAAQPQAQPCPLANHRAGRRRTQWNDTPDAIADCAACRPQSRHWRGFPLTTASHEADHSRTTTNVTH